MRHFVAGSLLAVLASPMAAQFEGTIVMNLPSGGKQASDMTYYVKNGQLAATVLATNGPMSGQIVRMIFDIPGQKMAMLMPMAMGNAKGVKMDIDLKVAGGKDVTREIKPLGSSETIAGYKCDDFQMVEDGKNTLKLCISGEFGPFATMSGAGRGARSPDWATVFGNRPMFPLKVIGTDGKVMMEATAVHRTPVQAEMFAVPDGYMDMGSMGNMMGGRGPGKP